MSRVEVRTNTHAVKKKFVIGQALQLMRALVTGGAGQVEELPGRLKYLKLPFECCVTDLRSQVRMVVLVVCISCTYLPTGSTGVLSHSGVLSTTPSV